MNKLYRSLIVLSLLLLMAPFSMSQVFGSYNILILTSSSNLSVNAQNQFIAMGHTATVIDPSLLITSYDYSPYDIIVFGYNSAAPADLAPILTANENCELGIVIMRADALVDDLDMGASAYWNDGSFQIDDNSHWITEPFANGPLPLDFTYKSAVTSPTTSTTMLGSVNGLASLLVHNTYKRAVMPYYGHSTGMPWNADADTLTNRVLVWAASSCCSASTNSISVTECGSYTAPSGAVYTSSAIVNDTIPNASGCDSVITIDMTINNLPDVTMTTTGLTITANSVSGTYQWLDCDDMMNPLSGEINQAFTATQNGSYAVTITENGCSDTSNCELITTVELNKLDKTLQDVEIYPNPANKVLNISVGNLSEYNLRIEDLHGRITYIQNHVKEGIHRVELNDSSGVYFVIIEAEGRQAHIKFIKE